MVPHNFWGWGQIAAINQDLILLQFPGFALWIDRTELQSRIPWKMPRSKSEAEFFRRLGYAVPDFY